MDYGIKAGQDLSSAGSSLMAQAQSAAGNSAQEACGLQAVGQRMVDAIKNLEVLLSQLQEAETRLNGSRPTDKGSANTPPRPVPNGTIITLMIGMDEISVRISHAQQFAA